MLAYDSLFTYQGGAIGNALNVIGQLAVAVFQLGLTDTVGNATIALYQNSDTVPSLPDIWNNSPIGNDYTTFNSIVSAYQPDVQNHKTLYQTELDNGNNVIVVAHSQGNFYVNQAHDGLVIPFGLLFSTVALATPGNNAVGNNSPPACATGQILPCYLTLTNDIITLVPFHLSSNTANSNHPGVCNAFPDIPSMSQCHDVNRSYLLGNVTGPSIIGAVVSNILSGLTIVETGAGTGAVMSTPAGIDCGTTCSAQFYRGSKVSLTATPDPGSVFSSWSGDCTGTNQTITVDLTATDTCTATYKLTTLMVSKSGNGTGTITSSPAGIDCGLGCSTQTGPFNGLVQLTEAPASGSIFAGWAGDCAAAGMSTTAQVTVNSTMSCSVTFSLGGQLTITKGGTGAGTVTSAPAGINCGPSCTTQNAPFLASAPVQLTAAAASGSSFMGWGGNCLSAGMNTTAQITLTSDKNCTATFGSANPAVRLNPFGTQAGAGPYNVEVVDHSLILTPAPQDITVTLLRDVISQCSGLLFSSTRTVVVSQNQSSAPYNFNAGRDPACNTLPITTQYTVTQAVLGASTVLDLSGVPAQQLVLSVTR
jgi:hypothetical protein